MSLHCHALYVVLSLFLSGLKSTESSGSLKLPEQERSVPIPGAGRRSSLADIAITLHTQSRGFFEGGILYAGITQILLFWYFELNKRSLDGIRNKTRFTFKHSFLLPTQLSSRKFDVNSFLH